MNTKTHLGAVHTVIATVIHLSQQMVCMGFNVSVHMVQLQQKY